MVPEGDAAFHRGTTIHPERPAPRRGLRPGRAASSRLRLPPERHAAAGRRMPRTRKALVPAFDMATRARTRRTSSGSRSPSSTTRCQGHHRPVTHGHVDPGLAYQFGPRDGSVVFSSNTTADDSLIALSQGDRSILVHQVADLGLPRAARHRPAPSSSGWPGCTPTSPQVGGVAERAGVGELILSHYLPAEPDAIAARGMGRSAPRQGFRAGPPPAGRDGLPPDPPTHYSRHYLNFA